MKDSTYAICLSFLGVLMVSASIYFIFTAKSIRPLSENFISDKQGLMAMFSVPLFIIGTLLLFAGFVIVMSSAISNIAGNPTHSFQVVSIIRDPQIIGNDYFEVTYLYNNTLQTARLPQSHVKVNQNKTELIGAFAYDFIAPMDSIRWELHVQNISELGD